MGKSGMPGTDLPSLVVRRYQFLLCLLLALAACSNSNDSEGLRLEVIEVTGLLDDRTLLFLQRAVERAAEAGREVAIVQLHSPGVIGSAEQLAETAKVIANPPLPLVLWLGPAPARMGGGSAQLFALAPYRAAAPGTRIENWQPAVAGGDGVLVSPPLGWAGDVEVVEPVDDLVDLVVPTLSQLVQELHGTSIRFDGGNRERELTTLTDVATPDSGGSIDGLTTIPVSFAQPSLWERFLRLAARPDAAFFFLVAGLTVAAFEMYAIGPGVAASVAAAALLLSSYGVSVLPVRGWAVTAALAGIAMLVISVQKGGVLALTLGGAALLAWSGLNFVNGAPQVVPNAFGVIFSVIGVLFFYLVAIPTVARARFSTQSIGRERLVGQSGVALTRFGPDGLVEIAGARWPATAHRAAGIERGSEVIVTAVHGWRIEVDPRPQSREN